MSDLMSLVKKALAKHNYEVSYTEPDCIEEREHKDGSVYYVVMGDDATHGAFLGDCTVEIYLDDEEDDWGTIVLFNDFINGWESSIEGASDEIQSEFESYESDILDLVEDLDDVLSYSSIEDDEQLVDLYNLATGNTVDEYYSYEDAPDEDEYDEDDDEDDEDDDEDDDHDDGEVKKGDK